MDRSGFGYDGQLYGRKNDRVVSRARNGHSENYVDLSYEIFNSVPRYRVPIPGLPGHTRVTIFPPPDPMPPRGLLFDDDHPPAYSTSSIDPHGEVMPSCRSSLPATPEKHNAEKDSVICGFSPEEKAKFAGYISASEAVIESLKREVETLKKQIEELSVQISAERQAAEGKIFSLREQLALKELELKAFPVSLKDIFPEKRQNPSAMKNNDRVLIRYGMDASKGSGCIDHQSFRPKNRHSENYDLTFEIFDSLPRYRVPIPGLPGHTRVTLFPPPDPIEDLANTMELLSLDKPDLLHKVSGQPASVDEVMPSCKSSVERGIMDVNGAFPETPEKHNMDEHPISQLYQMCKGLRAETYSVNCGFSPEDEAKFADYISASEEVIRSLKREVETLKKQRKELSVQISAERKDAEGKILRLREVLAEVEERERHKAFLVSLKDKYPNMEKREPPSPPSS